MTLSTNQIIDLLNESLDVAAVPQTKGFNPAEYVKVNYHMFSAGEVHEVKLHCEVGTMDAMIDRFGYDVNVSPLENGEYIATVKVAVNSVFFGWVFGFDGKVKIASPQFIAEKYKKMVGRA